MSPRPRPAFVDDNPVMAGAFAAFMGWAWDQPEMHAAFCEATGHVPLSPETDRLAVLIDEATGLTEGYTVAFIEWLIRNQWGEASAGPEPAAQAAQADDAAPGMNPKKAASQ